MKKLLLVSLLINTKLLTAILSNWHIDKTVWRKLTQRKIEFIDKSLLWLSFNKKKNTESIVISKWIFSMCKPSLFPLPIQLSWCTQWSSLSVTATLSGQRSVRCTLNKAWSGRSETWTSPQQYRPLRPRSSQSAPTPFWFLFPSAAIAKEINWRILLWDKAYHTANWAYNK